jgi:hypothetical protein
MDDLKTQYLRRTLEPLKLALEAHQRSLEELERALIEVDEALSGREERPERPQQAQLPAPCRRGCDLPRR